MKEEKESLCEVFKKEEEDTFVKNVLKWKSKDDLPTEDIIKLFSELNIYPGNGESYFVKGPKNLLKSFENYYRLLAALNKNLSFRSPCIEQIYRYAHKLTYGDEEGNAWFGTSEDLLILTEGTKSGGRETSNTEAWLKTKIVKHVENRKNCNQVTLILSEREIPLIKQDCSFQKDTKSSGVMVYVDLPAKLGLKVTDSVQQKEVPKGDVQPFEHKHLNVTEQTLYTDNAHVGTKDDKRAASIHNFD